MREKYCWLTGDWLPTEQSIEVLNTHAWPNCLNFGLEQKIERQRVIWPTEEIGAGHKQPFSTTSGPPLLLIQKFVLIL